MRIIEYFSKSLRNAAKYNPDVQAAPCCILWTDADRQWEVIVPRLQAEVAELFILGDYAADLRRGPSIWLRCVLARTLGDVDYPASAIPIFYLPGISRQDLRAVDNCSEYLKPLAELQYRGVIWSQVNAKDWTILAYLQSAQGGLNLDIATDKETKTAMQLALPSLMEVEVDQLRNKRLDREDFYSLISADPAGELLKWLNDPDSYRTQRTDIEWQAFVELCRYHFAFDVDGDGPIIAAEKLANRNGPWMAIWHRYREAASRYKNIANQIRRATPPSYTLDWRDPTSDLYEGWLQWNDYHEDVVRTSLASLANQVPSVARATIIELEQQHKQRRDSVWAELGMAPLAQALEHLATLVITTAQLPLNGGTMDDLAAGYQANGWRADDAVLRALATVKNTTDQQAVDSTIRTIYLSWAEDSARYLQQIVEQIGYPEAQSQQWKSLYSDGMCVLFVDGLRFDVAQRLIERLKQMHLDVQQTTAWAALPSVTATGKPAVSPVWDKITGSDSNTDFEPEVAHSHRPTNQHHFSKLLSDSGWQILKNADLGNGSGKAWTEIGTIDQAGHADVLPYKLDSLLIDISNHIQRLLNAGWKRVQVVTDHGWLYLRGGLPKRDLPSVLTDNQWGRCAVIKLGAIYSGKVFPWFWNPDQHFALADGIGCFRSNMSYAHGGLSLQECLTIHLMVTQGKDLDVASVISITEVDWRELRCDVFVTGGEEGLSVDIRRKPSDSKSSIASKVKPLKSNGTVSLVVEDEDLRGSTVHVVVMNDRGQVLTQKVTVIGGETDA